MVGLWVTLGVLAGGLTTGILLRVRDGSVRAGRAPRELPTPVAEAIGPGVTLVQISTTFCAPCRHTSARLGSLAEQHEGLRHVDIDVTNQPEVAHSLGVLRTPTTIAYTESGGELFRVSGLPDSARLLDALRPHLAAR